LKTDRDTIKKTLKTVRLRKMGKKRKIPFERPKPKHKQFQINGKTPHGMIDYWAACGDIPHKF